MFNAPQHVLSRQPGGLVSNVRVAPDAPLRSTTRTFETSHSDSVQPIKIWKILNCDNLFQSLTNFGVRLYDSLAFKMVFVVFSFVFTCFINPSSFVFSCFINPNCLHVLLFPVLASRLHPSYRSYRQSWKERRGHHVPHAGRQQCLLRPQACSSIKSHLVVSVRAGKPSRRTEQAGHHCAAQTQGRKDIYIVAGIHGLPFLFFVFLVVIIGDTSSGQSQNVCIAI